MTDTRTESDSMGPIEVPSSALWGAQTQRSFQNFKIGGQRMPGICLLPGPNAKKDWPPKDKYQGAEKIPGMCQLCSTVCGIIGYVKDGRVLKVEGNPNDPNSRGRLCARGQASLNHLYHPERLLYPMKRVGKRGEGKWKRISWDEALTEIWIHRWSLGPGKGRNGQ